MKASPSRIVANPTLPPARPSTPQRLAGPGVSYIAVPSTGKPLIPATDPIPRDKSTDSGARVRTGAGIMPDEHRPAGPTQEVPTEG
jgi:hypothetical protein